MIVPIALSALIFHLTIIYPLALAIAYTWAFIIDGHHL